MEPHFRHLYEPAVDKVGTRVHLAGHKDVRLGHVHLELEVSCELRQKVLFLGLSVAALVHARALRRVLPSLDA